MQPIAPRREFVNGLNRRIQDVHRTAIIDRAGQARFTLLALAAILSLGMLAAVLAHLLAKPRRNGPRRA
jgi:hypothetical protein